ncbi:MAG: DUF362 domain-containing protein [Acidobacteria bacterium]|nr:DUF362 domain-containing protein [Acidobacteriota bacterium]
MIVDPSLRYPDDEDGFPPDEAFPEYRCGAPSRSPNPVYRAVRECFAQARLDGARFGTPAWNPLAELIRPASRVFVLCNFVQHHRPAESSREFMSKCIHGSVLRALIDYVLLAVGPEGRVTFGNAPLQSASWEDVLRDTGASSVLRFYESAGANVRARDLRLLVTERGRLGNVTRVDRRSERDAVGVDLGSASLLADLPAPSFRVPDYSPDETAAFHQNGRHVYVLHREIVDADVIVSLPKLKTHQKVGITCALKGLVGAIARKDCLAHFRSGPATRGGDEYPADPIGVLRAVSRLHDNVQRIAPERASGSVLRAVDMVARRVADRLVPETDGSWHGNDTAWRMTLDIVRAATFARRDGTLARAPQRQHLVLVDGILGGHGNGPLSPDPIDSRALIFSDDLAAADRACAALMGLDGDRIPLVRESDRVLAHTSTGIEAIVNGITSTLAGVGERRLVRFSPPAGWRGRVECL